MALMRKYATAAEVPAELRAHYVERDGAMMLDCERDPKLEEFRATNVATLKELAELKARYEGIDPEAVRKLATEKARLEEEQRLKDGKHEEVWTGRMKTAQGEFERQLAQLRAVNEGNERLITGMVIDQAVLAEATKRGLRPVAIPDLNARARGSCRLVGGQARFFEADGQTVRVGKDGVTPMTVAEWVGALGTDAPHLFEANAGGGAAGSGAGGAGGGGSVNPWSRATWNLTEQAKLLKTNPGLAAQMEASAKH